MKSFTSQETEAIQAAIEAKDLDDTHKQVLAGLIKKPDQNEDGATLYVDGAADLHSKTAGIGGAIFMNGQEIYSFAEPLTEKTNNEAEYMAMIKGIQVSLELNIKSLNIYSDSELVVKQVNGEYKIKNDRMKRLHTMVLSELNRLENWSLIHVLRQKNKRADALSKQGMQIARNSQ